MAAFGSSSSTSALRPQTRTRSERLCHSPWQHCVSFPSTEGRAFGEGKLRRRTERSSRTCASPPKLCGFCRTCSVHWEVGERDGGWSKATVSAWICFSTICPQEDTARLMNKHGGRSMTYLRASPWPFFLARGRVPMVPRLSETYWRERNPRTPPPPGRLTVDCSCSPGMGR